MAADIIGLTTACLGYAWGAILVVCVIAVEVVLVLVLFVGGSVSFSFPALAMDIGCAACVVQNDSWRYYKACQLWRLSVIAEAQA